MSIEFRKDHLDSNETTSITEVTNLPETSLLPTDLAPESTPAFVQVPTSTPNIEYLLRVVLKAEEVAWLQVTTNDNRNVFSGGLVPQKEYRF